MSAIHIVTVGTSAITNNPPPGHQRAALVAGEPAAFAFASRIANLGDPVHAELTRRWVEASVLDHVGLLRSFRDDGDRSALAATTAELSSLALVSAERGALGRVVLLASDTPNGRTAAEIVQLAGQSVWRDAVFEVRVCDGLDPDRPDAFVTQGLENLRSIAREIDRDNPGVEVVINITGGLKGGIPFMTVLAIELERDLVYLFERATALTWISGRELRKRLRMDQPNLHPAAVARNWSL